VLRESDSSWYLREEAGGFLLGPYEIGAPACYVDGPDAKAEYELFQDDLDRLAPHIETAIARVPAFGEVGVKKVYNGAIAYTPDGSPIIGPAWEVPNFWLNEGHSFGVTAAGGAGWQLAEWIVDKNNPLTWRVIVNRLWQYHFGRGIEFHCTRTQ
jgi:dimethylglycine dehydrogenase